MSGGALWHSICRHLEYRQPLKNHNPIIGDHGQIDRAVKKRTSSFELC
jgi:hypothetical protein